ncbi:MAG: hypothetical protein U0228_07330 [Myxococcaceae bacterium]
MKTFFAVVGLSLAVTLLACGGRPCATAKCPEQCVDETGRTTGANADRAPVQSGTCGTVSCTAGCSCSKDNAGMPACLCTGAIPPNPGFLCVAAPNCGTITCTNGCSCADAGASACACN